MLITRNIVLEKGSSTYGTVYDVRSFDDLCEIILTDKYCLGTFQNNKIVKPNFLAASSIALDFDGGYSLKTAQYDFKDFKHIIATTKSHQKKKNNVIDDRFRVILFFKTPITDNATFLSTFNQLRLEFPNLDEKCSNTSRWFYPSRKVISVNKNGKIIDPILSQTENKVDATQVITSKGKGRLSKSTRKYLMKGIEPGNRNSTVFKIAKDFQENKYTEEEAIEFIGKALTQTKTLSYDFTIDEVETCIRSAYANEGTNVPRKPFHLIPLSELYKVKTKLEWIVDRLLSKGGVSLVSAVPKAGKSHIVRQLISNILTHKKFLGRSTTFGEVHYYAIEEQAEIINMSFQKFGIPANVPLYIHVGDVFSDNPLDDFYKILVERKPVLAVIDTLFDVVNVENENNYKDVKKEMRKLRQIARDTGTHILCIHHSNKGYGGVTGNHRAVLGSQAIVGGVDTIILIELSGDMRVITTMGRSIKPWVTRELIYDAETELYKLGPKVETDNF